jgi:hypothetical protein
VIWGAISTFQIIQSSLGPSGGNDLYTYWYAGLHIRQGTDPYRAFLDGQDPELPIRFIGAIATDKQDIVRQDLQPAPGLTLPLIVLLSPFALLSFELAKIGWFSLLIFVNVMIPWLLLYAISTNRKVDRYYYLLFIAIFLGMSSTRYATISGQPSILVIAMMLLSWIWSNKRPYLAGLLLGLALSKYSLALGFWIYFTFFEWRPRLSLTAAGVQIIGLLGLAWLGDNNLLQATNGYIQLFLHHAPMEGIQLTSLFPGVDAYSPLLALILTIMIGLPLLCIKRGVIRTEGTFRTKPTLRSLLLTILTFWSLMVAYHRAYDLQVFIIALGSFLLIHQAYGEGKLDKGIMLACSMYISLSILVLSIPAGGIVRALLPPEAGELWIRVILRSSTWVILSGMVLSILLVFRLHPIRSRTV